MTEAHLTRPTWRWANVPLPERYLAALGVAALLHLVSPLRVPIGSRLTGWALLLGGAGLAGWAVASAGETSVDRPEALVTTGAYRVSRNPMYLGWAAALLGLGLITRSAWLLVAWLHAGRAVHGEVLDEERALAEKFGAKFDDYRARTPRYAGRVVISATRR